MSTFMFVEINEQ